MPLKLRKPCRQVFHLPSTLNFEGVSPGTLFSSSIKWHESCCVLARDVVQFTSSGSLYYSYERLLTCAKKRKDTHHNQWEHFNFHKKRGHMASSAYQPFGGKGSFP